MAASVCRGVIPSSDWATTPAAICRCGPPTRFMKYSSRFEVKIPRKRTRLQQRRASIKRLVQHATVKLQPGEVAAEEFRRLA